MSIALLAMSARAVADPIQPQIDSFGNVTWGPADPNVRPIKDKVPSFGDISFYWTTNNAPSPGYGTFSQVNDTFGPTTYTFIAPDDPTLRRFMDTGTYAEQRCTLH